MLPVGVLIAFIAMHLLGMNSNSMSLGGIAIAIGAMVDAAIVMIENAHKHIERLKRRRSQGRRPSSTACKEVGPALFFSLLIITVSFLPVFTLESQEGRLFLPLAYTKTFSMAGAALLSVTLVPVLMMLFIRGRVMPERKNPVNRFLIWMYRPDHRLGHALEEAHHRAGRWAFWALSCLSRLAAGLRVHAHAQRGHAVCTCRRRCRLRRLPRRQSCCKRRTRSSRAFRRWSRFTARPGAAKYRDRPCAHGDVRDRDQSQARVAVARGSDHRQADRRTTWRCISPASNAWTMPIKARIDMLSTGIRTPIGIKVFGKDLNEMERLARKISAVERMCPAPPPRSPSASPAATTSTSSPTACTWPATAWQPVTCRT